MAHDVFISYASEDKAVADAACARLESRKLRCWIAPRDVVPGQNYGEAIVDAIRASHLLVLVFSSHSNRSEQVMREVERAVHFGLPILPFRIEDSPPSGALEYFISAPHWLDALTPPVEAHLDRLAETASLLMRNRAGEQVVSPADALIESRRSATDEATQPTHATNSPLASRRRRAVPVAIALTVIAALGYGMLPFERAGAEASPLSFASDTAPAGASTDEVTVRDIREPETPTKGRSTDAREIADALNSSASVPADPRELRTPESSSSGGQHPRTSDIAEESQAAMSTPTKSVSVASEPATEPSPNLDELQSDPMPLADDSARPTGEAEPAVDSPEAEAPAEVPNVERITWAGWWKGPPGRNDVRLELDGLDDGPVRGLLLFDVEGPHGREVRGEWHGDELSLNVSGPQLTIAVTARRSGTRLAGKWVASSIESGELSLNLDLGGAAIFRAETVWSGWVNERNAGRTDAFLFVHEREGDVVTGEYFQANSGAAAQAVSGRVTGSGVLLELEVANESEAAMFSMNVDGGILGGAWHMKDSGRNGEASLRIDTGEAAALQPGSVWHGVVKQPGGGNQDAVLVIDERNGSRFSASCYASDSGPEPTHAEGRVLADHVLLSVPSDPPSSWSLVQDGVRLGGQWFAGDLGGDVRLSRDATDDRVFDAATTWTGWLKDDGRFDAALSLGAAVDDRCTGTLRWTEAGGDVRLDLEGVQLAGQLILRGLHPKGGDPVVLDLDLTGNNRKLSGNWNQRGLRGESQFTLDR